MEPAHKSVTLIQYKKFKHATIYWIENQTKTALIEATATYIPIDFFKEIFFAIEELVVQKGITNIIFDKRQLRVFHQPSMEWYFVEWKEKMAELGVTNHVKILPDDLAFCQSVKLGREQINRKYPTSRFHGLSIRYADSVEEAVLLF